MTVYIPLLPYTPYAEVGNRIGQAFSRGRMGNLYMAMGRRIEAELAWAWRNKPKVSGIC